MKIFVYNYKDDEKDFFDKISKECNCELKFSYDYPSLENAELARGFEGLSIYVTDMNADLLQKFYDMGVRYITTRSIGVNHFDLEKARELGLKIGNVAYAPSTVANYAIMLMLMCCRRAKYIMQSSSNQDFSLEGKRGIEMSGKTIGIIGTGKIGKTVLRHLMGFECRLIAYDVYQSEDVKEYAEYVDLETLFRESDIISIHAPATKESYHLIDEKAIGMMKDGVIIINAARGDLVDTEALINNIENGKIGAAGLDVIENEYGLYYNDLAPKVIKNRDLAILKSFPNVIVTPHTAFYTAEAINEMIENAIRGCCLFAEGKKNPFEVI